MGTLTQDLIPDGLNASSVLMLAQVCDIVMYAMAETRVGLGGDGCSKGGGGGVI